MASTRLLRQAASRRGEKDRAVRLGRDEAFALQALNGAAHRHVRDAEAARQIDRPGFAGLGDQLGNQFDVVLRRLLRVLATGAADSGGARWADFGGVGRHLFPGSKSEKNCFDNFQSTCSYCYIYKPVLIKKPYA